ncbi:MAG TPA: hypothetical protein VF332_04745 [Vicinamibacterales bacterium]
MQDFEKLGVFYLGRPYDLARHERGKGWLLYDSRDLVTHAVCVGMTGSGKTGLCLSLLEEAAIDKDPAIVIDPKGDLGNLLLTFPALRPEDFAPWVNPDDARRKGVSVEEYARQQAELWKKGLAEWEEDGERISRLRDSADFAIYTPGSEAGLPVSILKSLAAPAGDAAGDGELFRERVTTTVTSLLGLLGLDADPVKSRDHILLSTLIDAAWRSGKDTDLPLLIQQIQSPPMARVGVFDLESFYPAKERFGLAMALNNLLASPGFNSWMTGDPLDIQQLLYTAGGKPRVSIFSISHLGDAERMFFVSLLLNQVVGWMRAQGGTTSLRAVLYMDEISGYFPPVANPPSKAPFLTLLKQGRAFGLGVVLATQNPVDLDYKGLSNAGTWFLGRLQTERDKARVLEGLEGAAATAGSTFDKGKMEETLAGLGSRIFLMNNVHEDQPVVFETRWALSYLRGPLGRQEIKRLMDPIKSERLSRSDQMRQSENQHQSDQGHQSENERQSDDQRQSAVAVGVGAAPVLPPGVDQYFLPVRGEAPEGSRLVYAPMLLGVAQVRFTDPKVSVDATQTMAVTTPISDAPVPVDWSVASESPFGPSDLEREAAAGAGYDALPASASKAKSYEAWRKSFVTWIYGAKKLELLQSVDPDLVSQPGEAEGPFRVRLQQAARESRDQAVEQLRQQYAPRIAALQERLRRAQAAQERESGQASAAKLQTAISFGATLLGAIMGRKSVSMTTIGRATTAARGVGRSMKEAEDAKRAGESVGAVQQQIDALEAELRDQTATLETKMASGPLQTLTVAPKKTGIEVQLVALTWVPFWQDAAGTRKPAA